MAKRAIAAANNYKQEWMMLSNRNDLRTLSTTVILALTFTAIAKAQVLYVDDDAPTGGDGLSWSTAYNDLQDAIGEASVNTVIAEIRIAEGTYSPDSGSGDRLASFDLSRGLSIIGGYVGEAAPDERDPAIYRTILTGDLSRDDVPNLVDAILCFTVNGIHADPGCEEFDLNGDGDVDERDLGIRENSYRVMTISNADGIVTIDGVTISGGYAWYTNCAAVHISHSTVNMVDCRIQGNLSTEDGTGILLDESDLTMSHCTVQGNVALGDEGAGIYATENANIALTDCVVQRNDAWQGGGVFYHGGRLSLLRCHFLDNTGGGCTCHEEGDAISEVVDCVFRDNIADHGEGGGFSCYGQTWVFGSLFAGNISTIRAGGGLYVAGESSITNCLFLGNTAIGGGGVATRGEVELTNNVVSGNLATDGAGGGVLCSSPYFPFEPDKQTMGTMTNCTVVNNICDSEEVQNGVGAILVSMRFSVTNCIFHGNGVLEFSQVCRETVFGYSAPFVTHSCIEGLHTYSGFSNIGEDPLFVNPLGDDGIAGTSDDDLRLTLLSPCTDKGNNEVDIDTNELGRQPLPPFDLDVNIRFVDSPMPDVGDAGTTGLPIVDMGAYEFQYNGDCNGNWVLDDQDLAEGTSYDCNTNTFPDECELTQNDCNNSGIPDECELSNNDCNANNIPDDCELLANDCNSNGTPDECELDDNDCNSNETPDDCELEDNDCNANGLPDDCEYVALLLPAGQPSDQMACSNGMATFAVIANKPACTYQWYKGSHFNPLTNAAGKIDGAHDATLHIYDANDTDEGLYFCEVADGCIVRDTEEAELTVIVRPIIRSYAADSTTCEGGSVVLSVTHDGWLEFPYKYIWRRNGVPLADQPKYRVLTVNNASVSDDGVYTCEVVNTQCGMSELSPEMDVQVIGARFLEQPATQCHQSGETAVFDMAVEYENPISGYVWQRWYDSPYNRWINVAAPAAGDVQPLEVTASADTLYRGGVYLDNACWSYSDPATLHVGNATGDLDGDGDIDLMDMAKFTECFGLDSDTEPECTCADFDWANTVINLDDWSRMEAEITGPGDIE